MGSTGITVANQKIELSVLVNIGKCRHVTIINGINTSQIANFGKASITIVPEENIALVTTQ